MHVFAEYDKFLEDNKAVSLTFPIAGYRAHREKKDVDDENKNYQVFNNLI